LTADSRRVQPGDVFVAYPGAHVDGRDFIAQAVQRGAAAVIAEAGPKARVGAGDAPIIEVAGLGTLCGEIAHLVYGRPSENSGWRASPAPTARPRSRNGSPRQSRPWVSRCAVIGTLGNGFVDALAESPNTTPDAITLHAALAGFLERGARPAPWKSPRSASTRAGSTAPPSMSPCSPT
jgi:UDP-N-acetylmuramoyl-L-alanyl-D-glutamate--2,6-diaminopimelate ligase